MSILGKFTKQPSEILDYDVDYTDWFSGRTDTPVSITTVIATGITEVSHVLNGMVAKVILSGGTDGQTYKITVRLTTTNGIVREADFLVLVKES